MTRHFGKGLRSRRLWLIGALCLLLCVLIAGGTLLALRGDWRYRIALRFRRYPSPELTAQQPQGGLTEYTQEAFLADSRVTVTTDLMLINGSHPVPEGYSPDLTDEGGCPMLPSVLEAFRQMNDAVRERTGTRLYVLSGWRSAGEQEQEWLESGEKLAAKPGYSEHQTGMALDVCVMGYGGMSFLKTEAGRNVNDRCGDYGFIIRYPDGREDETGMSYEPWHLRYVGAPHSDIIMRSNLTLEAYLECLIPDTLFRSGEYYILRTAGQTLSAPTGFVSCTVSEDNCGYRIYTFRMASLFGSDVTESMTRAILQPVSCLPVLCEGGGLTIRFIGQSAANPKIQKNGTKNFF